MESDFLDSHLRHLEDAELLHSNERWANADQLFGLTVECGLKCLMQVFGMETDDKGSPKKKDDWKHANGIYERYDAYREGYNAGAYQLSNSTAFNDWNISDRYAHRSHFNQAKVDSHRDAAKEIETLINKAKLEGLL